MVVGAGSWGTAFARLLAGRGHETTLACRDPDQVRTIAETGRNPRFLESITLDGITPSLIEDAPLDDAELVVVAVPSRAFAEVVADLPGTCPVLSLTKGFDPGTGDRLSRLVRGRPVACLSGPNIADEVAVGLPSATVIASADEELAVWLQEMINSPTFRVYVNTDIVGVEFCGAAKNVIALAAGGVDGLGLGDNAKASLITRGTAEMARLGEAAGARDRDVRGTGRHGRPDGHVLEQARAQSTRRRADRAGCDAAEALAEIGHVVEGLTVAPLLRDLARRFETDMPITDGVCAVLDGASLNELAASIMGRLPKSE